MKFYTNKASYKNKDSVLLLIEAASNIKNAQLTVYQLNEIIIRKEIIITSGLTEINLGQFTDNLSGYYATLKIENNLFTTAFSIDSDEKIIRYGFLCDFEKSSFNSDIKWMNLMNLNYIQFYDWSYTHHQFISEENEYKDMMGKKNNLKVIMDKILECKKCGMRPMAYGPVYAADKTFYETHKESAYYSHEKEPLTFIKIFYLMNIGLDCSWYQNIISQYKKSIDKIGFSGIHMDTYGYPKRALDSKGKIRDLEKDFPIFVDKVSKEIPHIPLIFNNVGAWPLGKIMDCKQKAIYIEVWPPFETYYHLRQLIEKASLSGKPIILAAYIAAFRCDRPNALYSALFATFCINTLGATHLFLGEEGCVITQGYYCDYEKLNNLELANIKTYQDFFVFYQQLLFNPKLKDITMTHCGGDNQEYVIRGNYSLTCESEKISVIIRSDGKTHLIILENLENNNNKWNKGKIEPKISSQLTFEIQVFKKIESVYSAIPNSKNFLPSKLDFIRKKGPHSDLICFKTPKFKVGTIIWFKEK